MPKQKQSSCLSKGKNRLVKLLLLLAVLALPSDHKNSCPRPIGSVCATGITIHGEVTPNTAEYVKKSVIPGLDIVDVLIASPGGRFDSAQEISDTLKDSGARVRCVAFAAGSAAFWLLQSACDERILVNESKLAMHEAAWHIASGTERRLRLSDLERITEGLRTINKILATDISSRIGMPIKEYEDRVKDRNWVISVPEAIALGIADTVVEDPMVYLVTTANRPQSF